MKAQTCWERVNTAASEAEKLGNIQQKVGASQVRRRSLEAFSRSRFSANETSSETLTGGLLTVFSRKSAPQ